MLRSVIERLLGRLGFVVLPYSKNPGNTFLGLKSLKFASVVDVGSNDGQFARHIRRRIPGAALYCFEPIPGAFATLKAWADTQPNVHVYNMALGETRGSVAMMVHSDHTPSSSLLATTSLETQLYPFTQKQERLTVAVERLDDVLGGVDAGPETPCLVKMDVQGFEGPVIRGGRAVLAKAAACIVEISLDALYEGQSTFREIFLELDALSYRYAGNLGQVFADDGHVIYLDAVFVRRS